jgi:hypothetical protein
VLQTEVGTRDSVGGAAAAESCRRSTSLVTPTARQVTIGWVLRGHEPRRQGGRPMTQRERAPTWGPDVVAGTPRGGSMKR